MSDPFDLNRYAVGAGTPSAGAPSDPGWDTPSGGDARLTVGTPPVLWLVAAVVVALAGAGLAALVVRSGPATLLPWVLAGPVGIVLLGVYSIVDTRRRASSIYAAAGWVGPFYVAAVVVILAAVVVTAVNIAQWVGHL